MHLAAHSHSDKYENTRDTENTEREMLNIKIFKRLKNISTSYLGRQPVVELREPVLDGVDGNDAEDGPRHRVGQQQVDEGDDLHRLA